MASSLEAYAALMRSQVGVSESPAGSNNVLYTRWYYQTTRPPAGAAWCLIFQCWAHVKVGLTPPGFDEAAAPRGSAFTPTAAAWYRQRGRWFTRPQVGDLVFFDFPNDGVDRISHVGWVERVNTDGSITTIEGNTDAAGGRTGGKVMRKTRRGASIVGYGRPDYEEADVLTDGDKKWILARLEESERRIARYIDHGDAAKTGSGNHHQTIRGDLTGLGAALATVGRDVAALKAAGPTPAPAPTPLTEAELAELADLFLDRLRAGGFRFAGNLGLELTPPPAPLTGTIGSG